MKDSKFIDKFAAFAGRLGNQIHLKTLRDAFATVMPLYILAGLIVLLNNTVFKWIFQGDTLTKFQYWGITIANGTLSISGIIIAVMVGYFLAKNRDFENPLAASMLSLVSLIVMMPNTVSAVPDGAKDAVNISGVLSFNNTGTNVKALQINLGDNIPPAVGKSFSVLLPVMTVISLFGVVSALLFNLFGTNLISIITVFIQEPIRHIGTSLIGVIIIYSLGNMLWLFGIHQAVIYSAILEPLLLINITENIAAANNGQAIPHIINLSQVQTFALMGGSGSTLCLLVATFLVSRNAASKNVAKLSFGPGLFNINEPVLFGYPIVYNISLAIPFIAVPALGILISYLATAAGFMSPAFVQVPWTTPVFLNAWLATAGDFRAILVQLVIFALGVLLYIPFIKVNDKVVEQEMKG